MKKGKLEFTQKKRLTIYGLRTMHRWKLTASNGNVLCASSEDFYNKADCVLNAERTGFWLNILNTNF